MNNVKKLQPVPKRRWDKESLLSMFHGTLQAEFSELVEQYLPGIPKDEFDMVRDEDFNQHLTKALEIFFAKHPGLPSREDRAPPHS